MNRILSTFRCRCNEDFSITKINKSSILSEGKPLQYPKFNEIPLKTFQIKYKKNLSSTAKCLLNSFQNKYIYYAIDDVLDTLRSNPTERDNLLAILYSSIISLQNNFFISFFDIWISEIYIYEIPKTNKFLHKNFQLSKQLNFIIIKFFYKPPVSPKNQESLW